MNQTEYEAELRRLNARPPGANAPGQKFKRGVRVKLSERAQAPWKAFAFSDEAIVAYTYKQKFGSGGGKDYSLVMLNDAGQPINACSWFDEVDLTLVDDDVAAGLRIIANYEASKL